MGAIEVTQEILAAKFGRSSCNLMTGGSNRLAGAIHRWASCTLNASPVARGYYDEQTAWGTPGTPHPAAA